MFELINMYILLHIFLIAVSLFIVLKMGKDIVTVSEARLFKLLILTFCIYVATAATWSLLEYGVIRPPVWVFKLNSSISYIGLALIAFWLYLFVMTRHDFAVSRHKWFRWVSCMPLVLVAVLLIVSAFTGIVFDVTSDEDGTMHIVNGVLYPLMTAFSMSYFLFIFIASIIGAVKTPSYIKKKEYVALSAAMIVIFVFVLGLSVLFKQLTILPMAVFAAIYIVFINLQESGINKDALTGLNNRRRATEYLREKKENATEQQPLVLFLCDINFFKEINDKHGHAEGDRALIVTAEVIKKVVSGYSGFCARYGGDEFLFSVRQQVLINMGVEPEEICARISEELAMACERQKKPYVITVSLGYVICDDPKKPSGYYFNRADEMLYANKKEYHEKVARG